MAWIPVSNPPSTCRTVRLRFDDDGQRDTDGFYWRVEGAWYKSEGSKNRKAAVHPVAWSEKYERSA